MPVIIYKYGKYKWDDILSYESVILCVFVTGAMYQTIIPTYWQQSPYFFALEDIWLFFLFSVIFCLYLLYGGKNHQ